MSVQEIQKVICSLPPADLAVLTNWFEARQMDAWDRQIEDDCKAGKLDHIKSQIEKQVKAGQYSPL